MGADDFRDYMLSFLLLRHLSDNYATAAKKKLLEINASVMAGGEVW
jgi:type I restriction enzyme M protein